MITLGAYTFTESGVITQSGSGVDQQREESNRLIREAHERAEDEAHTRWLQAQLSAEDFYDPNRPGFDVSEPPADFELPAAIETSSWREWRGLLMGAAVLAVAMFFLMPRAPKRRK